MFTKWLRDGFAAGVRLFALCCTLLVLAVAACQTTIGTTDLEGGEPQEIVFCASAVSPLQLPLWYAYENGLFDPYNLRVELTQFPNGSTAATAMIAGEADVCQIAASNIVNAVAAGEELALIGGLYDRHVYSLMVNDSITEASDLIGKSIAVTRPGAATDTSLRVALDHLGLVPDEMVTIISVGSLGDIHSALVAGSVDAAIEGVPLSILSRREGIVELLDLSQLPYPYQHLAVAANRRLLREQPEVAQDILRAISQAMHMMREDPAGTKEVMVKYLKYDPEEDPELLEETYQIVINQQLQRWPHVSAEAVQAVIDIAAETNPAAAQLTPQDVADFGVMAALEQSGFLETVAD